MLIRGGGDLGSGVALAVHRAGHAAVVVDLPKPRALRLHVAFARAAVTGQCQVAGVTARHAADLVAIEQALLRGEIPVWTRSERELRRAWRFDALVDARLRGLTADDLDLRDAPIVIALGPGWEAGGQCHAVIETCRGPDLGRVLLAGRALPHTGVPGEVLGLTAARMLRSAVEGTVRRHRGIGDFVEAGDLVATVGGQPVRSAIRGMIRGLKLDGVAVGAGHKIGDVDPRQDCSLLDQPTDKAQRIGDGVLEALRLFGFGDRTQDTAAEARPAAAGVRIDSAAVTASAPSATVEAVPAPAASRDERIHTDTAARPRPAPAPDRVIIAAADEITEGAQTCT